MDIDYNEKDWATPCPKYDCKSTACKCGLEYVNIPTSLGDDSESSTVAPKNGAYCNALVFYEANGHVYIYTKEGIPTLIDVDASDISILEQEVRKVQRDIYELREDIDDLIYGFDTVADMKAADLADGDYAKTLGYYSSGDGGGAYYKISSTVPSGYYETLTSGLLYAELVYEDTMNVKQFGAKGDGNTDDTTSIQSALDNSATVLVPKGTYMIDAVTNLKVRSNTKIILSNDATLEAITNSDTHYAILWLEDVTNVEISGGTLKGDRDTHTGDSGEWGHCIRIYKDCDNIFIHDIKLIDAWGDGIACGRVTGKIRTSRVYVNRARRNGYSIASASSFVSTDDVIENSGGTAPQCGVDIEPDYTTDKLTNVVFRNLKTKSCTGPGMQIYIKKIWTPQFLLIFKTITIMVVKMVCV